MGPAADCDDIGVELLGHTAYFVAAGNLVDEGGNQEDVYPLQVLIGVDLAAAVFEPDFPLVKVGTIPLGQGAGKEEHTLPWNGNVLEVAARGPGLY